MIPVCQLDPSTLSLWIDAHSFAGTWPNNELSELVDAAYSGDDENLVRATLPLPESDQLRVITLASTIWHEKRHFMDLILTNYGAFRFRQFVELYANVPAIIREARESPGKTIWFPLDLYADPIRRAALGAQPIPGISEIAKSISDRKLMLREDQAVVPSRFGPLQVGGESQLEALAYQFQVQKAQKLFGLEKASRAIDSVPDADNHHRKYRWAVETGINTGVVGHIKMGADNSGRPAIAIDDALHSCLLYASLASRHWKQEQVHTDTASSFMPAYRYASLIIEARQMPPTAFGGFSAAWATANALAKRLFDRTIIEEIEEDYKYGQEYLLALKQGAPEQVVSLWEEFQIVRRRLIDLLIVDPEAILSEKFNNTVHLLRPRIVQAVPGGEMGKPLGNWARVMGYVERDTSLPKDFQGVEWWWASIRENWDQEVEPPIISFGKDSYWPWICSDFAPLAKLAINGRSHRTILGPELITAESRLSHQFGLDIKFDPQFEFPRSNLTIGEWSYLANEVSFKCDLSSEKLNLDNACVFTKWEFFQDEEYRKLIFEHHALVSGSVHLSQQAFVRDWSPWVVHQRFSPAAQRHELKMDLAAARQAMEARSPPMPTGVWNRVLEYYSSLLKGRS